MHLNTFHAWLAAAEAPADTQMNPKAAPLQMLGMVALFGVVMYVLMIRPQQKKAREHADLLKNLRPGDKVITSGGMVGVVINLKENTLTLRSADTKMEILKSAISAVTERGGASSES